MSSNKIIITGTGKSGTTFLVHLLTSLGLDTGFTLDSVDANISQVSFGGLEKKISGRHANKERLKHAIIKSPQLCLNLLERAERWGWKIDHVYVSIRHFDAVARHRITRNERIGQENIILQGLNPRQKENEKKFVDSLSVEQISTIHEFKAASRIGVLMDQLTDSDIPYTFLRFPRTVEDPEYCRNKLIDLVGGISFEEFLRHHRLVADPKKVRSGG